MNIHEPCRCRRAQQTPEEASENRETVSNRGAGVKKIKGRRLRVGFECQWDARARSPRDGKPFFFFPPPCGNLIPSTTAPTKQPPLNFNI